MRMKEMMSIVRDVFTVAYSEQCGLLCNTDSFMTLNHIHTDPESHAYKT